MDTSLDRSLQLEPLSPSQFRLPTGSPDRPSSSMRLKETEAGIEAMRKENFALKMRLFYAEEKLEQQLAERARPDQRAESLRGELEAARTALAARTSALDEKSALLVKARNAIETLQAELELARTQGQVSAAAQKRADSLKSRVATQEKTIASQSKEIDQLTAQLASAREAERTARTELVDARARITAAEDREGVMQREIDQVRGELARVRDDLAQWQGSEPQRQHEVDQVRGELDTALANLRRVEDAYAATMLQLEVQGVDTTRLRSKLSDLNTSVHEKDVLLRDTKSVLQRLRDENDLLRSDNERLREHLASVSSQAVEGTRRVQQQASGQLEAREADLRAKATALRECETALRAARDQASTAERELAAVRARVDAATARADEAEKARERDVARLRTELNDAMTSERERSEQLAKRLAAIEAARASHTDDLDERNKLLSMVTQQMLYIVAYDGASAAGAGIDLDAVRFQDTSDPTAFRRARGILLDLVTKVHALKLKFEHSLAELDAQWRAQASQLEERVARQSASLDSLQNTVAHLRSVAAEAEQLRPLRGQLDAASARISELVDALTSMEQHTALLQASKAQGDEAVAQLAAVRAQLEEERRARRAAEETGLGERKQAMEAQSKLAETSNKRLSDAQARIARLTENNRLLILELEEKRRLVDQVTQSYRTAQVKNSQLLQRTQHLSEEMAQRETTLRDALAGMERQVQEYMAYEAARGAVGGYPVPAAAAAAAPMPYMPQRPASAPLPRPVPGQSVGVQDDQLQQLLMQQLEETQQAMRSTHAKLSVEKAALRDALLRSSAASSPASVAAQSLRVPQMPESQDSLLFGAAASPAVSSGSGRRASSPAVPRSRYAAPVDTSTLTES